MKCSQRMNKKRNIKLISKILQNINQIEANIQNEVFKDKIEKESPQIGMPREYDKFKNPEYLKERLHKVIKFWEKK